jgi:hypothetical protein
VETLEGRLAALENARLADHARIGGLEVELAELHSAREAAEQHLRRRLHWWKGTAGILLLVGLLIGPPQAGQAQGGTVEQRLTALETKLARVFVVNNGADIVIRGANLHIANGVGSTQTNNGLGNLIIGYNEPRGGGADVRIGSHNLILGQLNNYNSFGGLVGGVQNTISGPFASVVTGFNNQATTWYAFCATGRDNIPSANYSSVVGGQGNAASGLLSVISGGTSNAASGDFSVASGGNFNTAFGLYSTASGGQFNAATGQYSSVTSGFANVASGQYSTVTAGEFNTASGSRSTVSGGDANTASGTWSTVSGGFNRTAPGSDDWVAGGLFQDQ